MGNVQSYCFQTGLLERIISPLGIAGLTPSPTRWKYSWLNLVLTSISYNIVTDSCCASCLVVEEAVPVADGDTEKYSVIISESSCCGSTE